LCAPRPVDHAINIRIGFHRDFETLENSFALVSKRFRRAFRESKKVGVRLWDGFAPPHAAVHGSRPLEVSRLPITPD
jgi:hypothetical protein